MDIVLDIGSTETVVAVFQGDDLRGRWRVYSDVRRTPDEWQILLRSLFRLVDVEMNDVERVTLASVVPPVAAAIRVSFGRELLELSWRAPLPIRIDLDDPTTVGADRLANAVAAHLAERADAIVVDLGTATTYDCVTADGAFIGGAIAPGAGTAAEQLVARTSRLPALGVSVPSRVIGRSTAAALESGIFFAAVDAVDGMVERIRDEWGRSNAIVLATGGLAPLLAPHCRTVERHEPDLTLRGLLLARRHADGGGTT